MFPMVSGAMNAPIGPIGSLPEGAGLHRYMTYRNLRRMMSAEVTSRRHRRSTQTLVQFVRALHVKSRRDGTESGAALS